MNQALRQAMRDRLREGQLPCNHAFALARTFGVEPFAVGLEATEADIRISRCQLGLFGYGPKAEGKHKIVEPMAEVPSTLAERLRRSAGPQGITCAGLWKVADGLGYRRIEAAAAAETLGIRVSHCQLGCFPRPWTPPLPEPEAGPQG